jgi:hypothetical protein
MDVKRLINHFRHCYGQFRTMTGKSEKALFYL